MAYANGRLPASALATIPSGRLNKDAAGAWNAGPARAGCRPLGGQSSYRDYAGQLYFWNLYVSGRGNLAARPGTSNHGWGKAIDLQATWMRSWLNSNGARYGWRKVEAPSEWWHVNFVGGVSFPKPDALKGLTKRERKMAARLLYHRREYRREARGGKGPRYRRQYRYAKYWRTRIEGRMRRLRRVANKGGWAKHNRGGRYQILARVLNGKIK